MGAAYSQKLKSWGGVLAPLQGVLLDRPRYPTGSFSRPPSPPVPRFHAALSLDHSCLAEPGHFCRAPKAEEVREDVEARESVERLREYVREAVQRYGEVELFACWEGDQGQVPVARLEVRPDFFGGDAFKFEEKQFLLVREHSA